ncbi:MAG: SH3 domain-containing protein [Roseburia sp.]|nr:SH3 domain-containing protein [Roseburia sp.]
MKKTTINRILTGVITIMVLSICFLIVCIVTRPRYIDTTEPETAVIREIPFVENQPAALAEDGVQPVSETQEAAPALQGKTSTRVNVRNAPTEDGKVLATVDEGTVFEIVEILDIGWTHVIYDDQDAYISSSYVIIINGQ